jgi:hypothetical protein
MLTRSAEPLHVPTQLSDEQTVEVRVLSLPFTGESKEDDKIPVTAVSLHVGNQILNIPHTNQE